MKKIILTMFTVLLLGSTNLFAAELIDAGNKMCPVSGDDVSGKSFVEYQGKRYGICCKMCSDKFKKNPEKFITILGHGTKKEVVGHNHSHSH